MFLISFGKELDIFTPRMVLKSLTKILVSQVIHAFVNLTKWLKSSFSSH